jgi:hypothetical protein
MGSGSILIEAAHKPRPVFKLCAQTQYPKQGPPEPPSNDRRSVEPGLYMLLKCQKAAVRRKLRDRNQSFSVRLRFLTMRDGYCNAAWIDCCRTRYRAPPFRSRSISRSCRNQTVAASHSTTRNRMDRRSIPFALCGQIPRFRCV